MDVLIIAGLGIVVVLLSILLLKLHPLISLLLGSLFLLTATPNETKLLNQLDQEIVSVGKLSGDGAVGIDRSLPSGEYLLSSDATSLSSGSSVQLSRATNAADPSLNWYSISGADSAVSKGDLLVSATAMQAAERRKWSAVGEQLADGFAKTFRKLGIPVTMAAVVGICLLESGAAARLVAAIIAIFGPRGTAPALTLSGFLLGIPVYFDNVFYLLLPLAKAVGRARPEAFLSAVMAIIVGATMAHSLVPPTPGPLLVASAMKVSVGTMMIGGFLVGGIAASVGFTYGMLCRKWVHLSPEQLPTPNQEQQTLTKRQLPLWLAALPIALPIVALGGSEIFEYFAAQPNYAQLQSLSGLVAVFNNPGLIFIFTAIMAIAILRLCTDQKTVTGAVAKGIADAGTIVLLTCAGGAFGAALQQLGIADAIAQHFGGLTTPWAMLTTAFLVTTIIRAAQGSATVAMITAAAIVAPVMQSVELPFHPVYVALAIGCGSKPLPWMNDSGFWQVATMTGMNANQTLKTFTVALTLMGLTGFCVTLLGAWLLPLN